MTVRLILAFLALLVSLPATAVPACHVAPTTVAAGHAHHAPKPPAVADAHVCVGCAPLGDWLRAPLEKRIRPAGAMPLAEIASLVLGKATSPALPPPRLA